MKIIEIDAQERLVWLAWDDGWRQANGHILKIHGIEMSVVAVVGYQEVKLIFSTLRSGDKIRTMHLDFLEFLACDTKEKYLVELSEQALLVSRVIEKFGVAKVNALIEQRLKGYVRQFGPMPEIEIAEEEA